MISSPILGKDGNGTDLDDDGGDGLVGAEESVGAAGVLLGEFAHYLDRFVGCIHSSGCAPKESIQIDGEE